MVLESYDTYEYQIIECCGMTPASFCRKLNSLGKEGWEVVPLCGDIFNKFENAKVLVKRVIHTVKTD